MSTTASPKAATRVAMFVALTLLIALGTQACGDSLGADAEEITESLGASGAISAESGTAEPVLPGSSTPGASSSLEGALDSATAESDVFCTTNEDCEFGACVLIDTEADVGVCTNNCINLNAANLSRT